MSAIFQVAPKQAAERRRQTQQWITERALRWRMDLREGKDNFVFESWRSHLKGNLNRSYGDPIQTGMAPKSERELFMWIISSQLSKRPSYISARPFLGDFNDKASISLATIYLDFDSEQDPGQAIKEAARAYDWMEGSGIIPRVYFSGKKGVALYIDCQEPAVPQDEVLKKAVLAKVVQTMLNGGFKNGGLKTLDSKASGDLRRISKLPNTLHPGSGLYCIPLQREDLARGLDYIRSLAKEPRDMAIEVHDDNEFHETLEELALQITESRKAASAFNALKKTKAKKRASKDDTHCIGLSNALEGVGEGSRQLAALGLKKFFLSQGEEVSKLKEWNLLNNPPLDEETIQKIIDREPGMSWCFYLNTASLCYEDCPKLRDNIMGANYGV